MVETDVERVIDADGHIQEDDEGILEFMRAETLMGAHPRLSTKASDVSNVSSEVRSPRITSTVLNAMGGSKKCIPTACSGLEHQAAI